MGDQVPAGAPETLSLQEVFWVLAPMVQSHAAGLSVAEVWDWVPGGDPAPVAWGGSSRDPTGRADPAPSPQRGSPGFVMGWKPGTGFGEPKLEGTALAPSFPPPIPVGAEAFVGTPCIPCLFPGGGVAAEAAWCLGLPCKSSGPSQENRKGGIWRARDGFLAAFSSAGHVLQGSRLAALQFLKEV